MKSMNGTVEGMYEDARVWRMTKVRFLKWGRGRPLVLSVVSSHQVPLRAMTGLLGLAHLYSSKRLRPCLRVRRLKKRYC